MAFVTAKGETTIQPSSSSSSALVTLPTAARQRTTSDASHRYIIVSPLVHFLFLKMSVIPTDHGGIILHNSSGSRSNSNNFYGLFSLYDLRLTSQALPPPSLTLWPPPPPPLQLLFFVSSGKGKATCLEAYIAVQCNSTRTEESYSAFVIIVDGMAICRDDRVGIQEDMEQRITGRQGGGH